MKTIKYLFLGLFMATFTACIVSSCKDDDDESNQSIEGYWYCDLDTDEPEMMVFRGGKYINVCPYRANQDISLSTLKGFCDEALSSNKIPSGLTSDDIEFGTYSIKGSKISLTTDTEGTYTMKYSIVGNTLILIEEDGDTYNYTRYSSK